MRPCFAFSAAASDDKPSTLSIYDEIGFWGVQASDFRTQLAAIKSKVINVEINSPGGDVFAGLAIYNMLRSSGKEILVKVMGVAASAASLIAMAGDKIVMPKNTFMMVHNPWSFAMGNADELRETADTLDKIGASLLSTYVARTGKTEDEIAPLLAKDTWLTADEAKELGFADEVVADIKANAKFDMARADLPENVRKIYAAAPDPEPELTPEPEPTPPAVTGDVPTAVHDAAIKAGLTDAAPWIAVKALSVEEGTALIAQATAITSLCKFTKQDPKAAVSFIRAGKTLPEVRAALAAVMATEADANPVRANKNDPTASSGASRSFSSTDMWKRHEKASNSSTEGKTK